MMDAGGNDLGHGWPHWDDEGGPTIAARVHVRPDVEPVSAEDMVALALQNVWARGFWAGLILANLGWFSAVLLRWWLA